MARYIDAEKLLQRLEREVESCKDPNQGSALGFKMAMFIVQTLPKEDIAPRAEGEWIEKHRHRGGFETFTGIDHMGEKHTIRVDRRYECDDLYCSICGKLASDVSLNYCSNCGAKMKGGAE
jgi:hypothetical protein